MPFINQFKFLIHINIISLKGNLLYNHLVIKITALKVTKMLNACFHHQLI